MHEQQSYRIFISYSRRGNGPKWKETLIKSLYIFERHQLLDIWEDGKIRVSSIWDDDIIKAMESARVAVILVTKESLEIREQPDFNYITEKELPFLYKRQKYDKLIVIPVICEPCEWKKYDLLRATQALNNSNPLSALTEKQIEIIFRNLATDIAKQLSRVVLTEFNSHLTLLKGKTELKDELKIYLEKLALNSPGKEPIKIIGREQEIAILDLAFTQQHITMVSLVAWGGVGKSVLVNDWLIRLQRKNWFGIKRVYAWNFFSQGTNEDRQSSEDSFLSHALEWFGVNCDPATSPTYKGSLLADAISMEPTLLILDGIEPLQYPPGPMGGQLHAHGVQTLLRHLAQTKNNTENRGLCLVTTREVLTDLKNFERSFDAPWGSVLSIELHNLTAQAGASLLYNSGARKAGVAYIRDNDVELLSASQEVDNHALTLNLLGRFIRFAHLGDIRKRDLVKFEEADLTIQGGTTFKMLSAFENWFSRDEYRIRLLAVLRLIGLFDRPADSGCMKALRNLPPIELLTDSLFTRSNFETSNEKSLNPLIDEEWNIAINSLSEFGLLKILANENNCDQLIDCHSLIREYFAIDLQSNYPKAWQLANLRLYEYLSELADYKPSTVAGLQPLYEAITHGCQAGFHQMMCNLYYDRILRKDEEFSWKQLGTINSDLSTIRNFFESPWEVQNKSLSENDQGWVLNQASLYLRNCGRFIEAKKPIQVAIKIFNNTISASSMENAATSGSNLSELELLIGNIYGAIEAAQIALISIEKAKSKYYYYWMSVLYCDLGNAFYYLNQKNIAHEHFLKAEIFQAKHMPEYPFLYSLRNFSFSELKLAYVEESCWKIQLNMDMDMYFNTLELINSCNALKELSVKSRTLVEKQNTDLDFGIELLLIGRIELYTYKLNPKISNLSIINDYLINAFQHLLKSGVQQWIVCCLLSKAWLHYLFDNKDAAKADLDEAWLIADRSHLLLYSADIHLYRARLFKDQSELRKAKRIINKCKYWRRKNELADAEQSILN